MAIIDEIKNCLRLGSRWRNALTAWRNHGLLRTVAFKWQQWRCRIFGAKAPYALKSRHAEFPLKCRPGTTDSAVFWQIFIEREYGCLDDVADVGLVVDCGANVGYSSAYFLSRFPQCTVVAVEPDAGNFKLLEANLAPYGERARAVHSAVWSRAAGLKISEEPYLDGGAWARQVRQARPDETPDLQATDLATLLKEAGAERISILKMDIEGAEAVVFSANVESWLPFVDNLVIELHDDTVFGEATEVFHNAISTRGFSISQSGELTVCKASI